MTSPISDMSRYTMIKNLIAVFLITVFFILSALTLSGYGLIGL